MNAKKLIFIFVLLSTIARAQENIYVSCCEDSPYEYTTKDGANIFIPNVFTPNGDGINDLFRAEYHGKKVIAEWTTITDVSRDTIFFQFDGLDFKNVIPKWHGWDGIRYRQDGKPHEGPFAYIINFKTDEGIFEVKGTACVVRCNEASYILKDNKDCYYSTQSTKGKLIKGKNNKEKACFTPK